LKKKKVLIITYYWPPSGGPGVQRVLKFVKYLPQYGWEPIILTVKDGEYPALDKSLFRDVDSKLKIYKTQTREVFNLFRKLSGFKKDVSIEVVTTRKVKSNFRSKLFKYFRANFFIPDARVGWRPYGVRKGEQIIKEEKIDLIFTSSPPHSLQLIGMDLKNKFGIPWVADFRDPWTDPYWEHTFKRTKYAQNKNLKLEEKAKLVADHLITVSIGVKSKLLKESSASNCAVIFNGFDSDDFKDKIKIKSDKIRIKYAGHISSSQIPVNFFESFAKLNVSQKSRFEIKFFGKFDRELKERIKELEIENYVKLYDYIPHDQVVQEIINADLLLLLIPNVNAEGILTGKFFEYAGTGNTILAIGPPNSEIETLINQNSLGYFFLYADNLKKYFEDLLNEKITLTQPKKDLSKFNRMLQTKSLAAIFDSFF